MSQDYLNLNSVLFPGLVPEPPGQVAQARQHEEGAGAARAQRAPPDLLRGAHPTRGDHEARAAAEGEEAHQTGAVEQMLQCLNGHPSSATSTIILFFWSD